MDLFWNKLSSSLTLCELDEIIRRFKELLSTDHGMEPDRPSIAFLLSRKSLAWQLRFNQTMDDHDLSMAIQDGNQAIQLVQLDRSNASASELGPIVESFANSRYCDFRASGKLDSINTAIDSCLAAMDYTTANSRPWWDLAAGRLPIYLLDRLLLFPTEEYISEAVGFLRNMQQLMTTTTNALDPIGRARLLSRYGVALIRQYLVTRDEDTRKRSLDLGHHSIKLLPDPKLATIEYTNLASSLYIAFQQTLQFAFLEDAIIVQRLAKANEPPLDLVEEAQKVTAYGMMLVEKWRRYCDTDPEMVEGLLEEAIKAAREVIQILRPVGTGSDALFRQEKSILLTVVSPWFGLQVRMAHDPKFGEEGIEQLHEALGLIKEGHPERPRILNNLCVLLDTQHEALNDRGDTPGAIEKLNEALRYATEAANMTPEHDPGRGERYMNICKLLLSKWALRGGDLSEEDEAILLEARKYVCEAANLASTPLLIRVPATIQGARLYLRAGDVVEAHKLLQMGISLLPAFHPEMLSAEDLRATLTQVAGLSTLAASVALEAKRSPFEALKSLEAGRCVISGLSMTLKRDISRLQQKDEKLADAYEDLRERLAAAARPRRDDGLKFGNTPQPVGTPQQDLLQELAEMERRIRMLEGFESFQLPPSEEVVQGLASQGPIVAINVTFLRSDAIIITTKGTRSIHLKDLKHNDLEERIPIFEQLGNKARRNAVRLVSREKKGGRGAEALRWLWDVAVHPILDEIDADLGPSRRVWWITSGLAGRAPLHAAGTHTKGSIENTLSRPVVSSYISSIKAFQYARENSVAPKVSAKKNMLLVTMSNNPYPHHKLATEHEEKVIGRVFSDEMLLHLKHPDPEAVLKEIPSHSFVHFACHGASISTDPSKSGLLLVKDGKVAMLTVAQLEEMDLKQGAIAYLSACSTAQQPDGKLADEAIHLGNTFQASGFQHVIGTMWGANDKAAGEVAKRFYTKLTASNDGEGRPIEVARALHDAMSEYRDATVGEGKNVMAWGPFIHIGI